MPCSASRLPTLRSGLPLGLPALTGVFSLLTTPLPQSVAMPPWMTLARPPAARHPFGPAQPPAATPSSWGSLPSVWRRPCGGPAFRRGLPCPCWLSLAGVLRGLPSLGYAYDSATTFPRPCERPVRGHARVVMWRSPVRSHSASFSHWPPCPLVRLPASPGRLPEMLMRRPSSRSGLPCLFSTHSMVPSLALWSS